MARRKRKESEMEALLAAPWWVSAAFAAGTVALSQWIVPAWTAANPLTKGIGPVLKPFGMLLAAIFGFVAILLYVKQRPSKTLKPAPVTATGNQKLEPTAKPGITQPDAVDRAWGDAIKHTGASVSASKPSEWSIELLRQIEWKRVEELTAAYFREKTFRTETIQAGADGGIDVKLFIKDNASPFAVVQCKAWNTQKVGVKPVRELLGVMAHEKVAKGIFVTTGEYTQEAIAFAKENPITLITGAMLLKGVLALADDARARLLAVATEGDFTTPTCPSCGIKMARRDSDRGPFWGCSNYPRCKQKFFMKNIST